MVKYFYLLLITIVFISCKKEAGFGGQGSIKGKVYAYDYSPSGTLNSQAYVGGVNVYIAVTGSGNILKQVDSDYQGNYTFEELREGKYTLWVYSDCDSCTDNKTPVVQTIDLSGNKDEKVLPDFKINL
ncbi:MAG: hypothetical protein JNJ58_06455 [Chitinophagaceae bacterium]|nr:hypothetical protein [Chitinophagaceae bacterium]